MRIKKNPVAASSESIINNSKQTEPKYSEAIQYIQSAISSLSVDASNDELAKESIANLSVVLMDLKS